MIYVLLLVLYGISGRAFASDTKAVNRKFPVGSWVLRYYPPAAQHKLGSPWVGPHQVVRQATGHTVGIQRDADKPIIFVHVDDLKLCPGPRDVAWTPGVSTADMGRLQGPCNRLRLRLLEHIMITITITITRFINVIDYDYDYI